MSFDLALVLVFSTPVALAALGESIGQRAGVINVGLEGMMLTSGYFGVITAGSTGSAWLGVLAGVLAAIVLAAIQAVFTLKLALDQVVTGTAVNLLALGVTGTLFRMKYGQSGQLISVPKIQQFAGIDVFVIFMLLSGLGLTLLLSRTRWGLATRATGHYPDSAASAGISPLRVRFGSVLIAGLYAGLAGTYLGLGITGSFAENMTQGRGFVAIAMVTFGRWSPAYVVAASLLVGLAESQQFILQTQRTAIPFQLFAAMPYLLALVVLVVAGKGTQAPAALGAPYDSQDR